MGYYTKNNWTDYLRLTRHNNLAEMVFETIKYHGHRPVMRWFGEDGETVESITYRELKDFITIAFHGLCSLGYKKSDHISICAETSRFWAFADLGIQCLGAEALQFILLQNPQKSCIS